MAGSRVALETSSLSSDRSGGCGGGGFGCGTASASAAVRLRHDHRPFSTDWRVLVGGCVLCSHYGTATIRARVAMVRAYRHWLEAPVVGLVRALVVLERVGRSHGRGAVESCGRKPGNRPRGTRSLVRIRARDEAARREAGRRGRALNGRRDAPGLWSLMMMIGTSSNDE